MELKTPLYDAHLAAGGQMVSFAGWAMPIHYGSQLKEHQAVREDVGMFDVSHMTVVDIEGRLGHQANAQVALGLDVEGFQQWVAEVLALAP